MAKNKLVFACVFWLLTSLCGYGQSTVKRKAVIDTALSQVGVRELSGHNDGKDVEKYLKAVGLGKGFAWCAAFVSWDYKVNKITAFKTAWAPAWFPPQRVLKVGINPQPGDLGGLWINKRIGHVFIIYQWGDKVVKTIEGNTNEAGSREGDGVYVKRRLKKQIYVTSNWID